MDGSGTNSPRVTSQAQPTGTAWRSLHVHHFSTFSYPQQGDAHVDSLTKSLPLPCVTHSWSEQLGVARTGTLADSQHSIWSETQGKQLHAHSLSGRYHVDAVPGLLESSSWEYGASIATGGSETAADELSSIEASGASRNTELCDPPPRNKELDDEQWVVIDTSEITGIVALEKKPKNKRKFLRGR